MPRAINTPPAPRRGGEIVEEMLAAKREDGLSVRHLQTLRSHLRRFATAFTTCPYVHTPQAKLWREGWMESSRMARRHVHGDLRDRELPEVGRAARTPGRSPFSLLAQAANDSRFSNECPVCASGKEKFGVFCERCRDLLPQARWREHVPTMDDPEGYARWWVEACADLRGE